MKRLAKMITMVLPVAIGISACQTGGSQTSAEPGNKTLGAYADMALDKYSLALSDAKSLQAAINDLAQNPNGSTLESAKSAWLVSRESYGVTEIFRLSNGPIDAEEGWVADAYGALEGQINAWPLDENLIDYTIDENGNKTSGNIIDTVGSFNPGGEDPETVDVSSIDKDTLAALNENGGESNVATGYHAIEFLLWGQDQDYANFSDDSITRGPLTAGQRPVSDFTGGIAGQRRLQYLQASVALLIDDLTNVTSAWSKNTSGNCDADSTGCYRAALLGQLGGSDAAKNIPEAVALRQIISGMGVFIKSELANERIAVAVLTPSEEDEHSCFSDNTHRDISLNYQGFVNVLKSEWGDKSYGSSLYASASDGTREQLDGLIRKINGQVAEMNVIAESKWHFDYQILPGNHDRQIRRMKNDMRKLGDMMVSVAGD
ncbi:MAG: imelysin family protein, partial [Pseudomonadota bacterium]